MEEVGEGSSRYVQRAGRDSCQKANVPLGLNAPAALCRRPAITSGARPRAGKPPYFISAADGAVLSIAGLWDQWKDLETGEAISGATLIVTAANDFTRPIHERMPVFLAPHDHDAWLTGKAGAELLRPLPG